MNKIYAYLRVSTEQQAESQAGLVAQKDSCNLWALNKGSFISEFFIEEGISGCTGMKKRPALMEAINLLSDGDVLLVTKRDRIGRDPITIAMIEASINRKNAHIISAAGEGTEGNDSGSILMRRMVDAFAEFERNITCERTKAALQAKKKRGERTGHIPFGYRAKDTKFIELCPDEQNKLNEIKSLKKKNMSLRKIAQSLNERSIFNRNGSKWTHDSISYAVAKIS